MFLRAGTITPTTEPTESISEESVEGVELRVLLAEARTDAAFEYVDGDVAETICVTADTDHEMLGFVFEAANGCSISPERFEAVVEGIEGAPDTVTVEFWPGDGDGDGPESLKRVETDPAPGEWTVGDDGTATRSSSHAVGHRFVPASR